jgi:hypothetical protein
MSLSEPPKPQNPKTPKPQNFEIFLKKKLKNKKRMAGEFYSIFFTDWFRWCMVFLYIIMFWIGIAEVWFSLIVF